MLKKLSDAAASIAVFAFVVVSIAHACSGMFPTKLAVQQSPMNMGGGNPPCSKQQGDICQSVRDSILSIKPSVSAADNPHQTAPQLELPTESPASVVSLPVTTVSGAAFHPVFKLPLSVSFLVLRI